MCALQEYSTACSGNSLPAFQDNLWISSSRVQKSFFLLARISWPLKMGPIVCPGRLVRNYHPTMCNIQEEQRSHLPHVRSMQSCTLFAGTLWLWLEIHGVQRVCWFLPHKECLKISKLNLWRELYHYSAIYLMAWTRKIYHFQKTILLYAFFWVIPRHLNFIRQHFGTLFTIFTGR